MSNYGEVAVRAVGLLLWETGVSAPDAWGQAVGRVFAHSPSSREKSCPKSTFLGLCEEGVVVGVEPGSYTRSRLNRDYALQALEALRKDPTLAGDKHQLWRIATQGRDIRENSQMEVLLALWNAELLRSAEAGREEGPT